MTREELAQEIDEFVSYAKNLPGADELNVINIETTLGIFASWLHRKANIERASGLIINGERNE